MEKNFENSFEKILRKLVVPTNDKLQDVRVDNAYGLIRTYYVIYYVTEYPSDIETIAIDRETSSLLNMMGYKEKSLVIRFRKVQVVKM